MLKRVFSLRSRDERGQTMILFAVLASGLMMMMGLAIEGGNVFVQYRHLQAAADVAALTGAQDLPCASGSAQCSTATSDACTYAQKNGFTCTPDASTAPAADVPPVACSPYNAIDYGNGKLPSNSCTSSGTASTYSYIEVRLSEPMQIPIFNLSFTLSAHAVAKHGAPSPKDFALVVLDPSMNDALKLGSSNKAGIIVVGSVASNSTSNSSISTTGTAPNIACDGRWFTTSTESAPSTVYSSAGGVPDFSPPTCTPSSTTPLSWSNAHPPIPDPYAASCPPPTTTMPSGCTASSMGPYCTQCDSYGYVYSWTTNRLSGTWTRADDSKWGQFSGGSNNFEFFPGIYPSGISLSTGANVYFNPGVYTITGGGVSASNSVTMCIYGAPDCDLNQLSTVVNPNDSKPSLNCSDATFGSYNSSTAGDYTVTSSTWYYYCSPWGIWDTNSCLGATVSPCPGYNRPVSTTAPTFYGSSTKLNGVTFYMAGTASNNIVKLVGSSQAYLAFPNPCAGTDTSSQSGTSVTFGPAPPAHQIGEPSGMTQGVYTYPTSSLAYGDGVTASPAGQVYPNADLTLAGELQPLGACQSAPNVWQGEFDNANTVMQHLHFLIWERNPNATITLAGGSGQNWWGIIYNPGNGAPTPCSNPNQCSVTLTGNSGGFDGPPMLAGQVIADNVSISGAATVEVFYRPCPTTSTCDTGPGTGLVE